MLALTPLTTLVFTLAGAALLPDAVQPEAISGWNVAGAVTVVAGSLLVAVGARPLPVAESLQAATAPAPTGSVARAGSGAGVER